jgi:hypothetical protein
LAHPPSGGVNPVSANSKGEPNAKFKDFMRRLVAVPHSEIKAKLDAATQREATSQGRWVNPPGRFRHTLICQIPADSPQSHPTPGAGICNQLLTSLGILETLGGKILKCQAKLLIYLLLTDTFWLTETSICEML